MKKPTLQHAKITTFAATLAFLAVPAAQANLIDGVVDIWNVDVNTIFLGGSEVWQAGEPDGTVINDKHLEWGDGDDGPSSLVITNSPSNQNVPVNSAPLPNISITHNNNVIDSDSGELDSVTINSTLTLTPFMPAGPALPPVVIDFMIMFDETPNGADPCIGGGANGAGININGCADIFVTDTDLLNTPFFYDLDGAGAMYDPVEYFISFFEASDSLITLPDAACASVGAPNDCIGFRTAEDTSTTAEFASFITTEPVGVPEPGTLALIGIGLLGLGYQYRIRKAI